MNEPNAGRGPVDYELTCWYVNARRVMGLVGIDALAIGFKNVQAIATIDDNLRKNAILSVLEDGVVRWLRQANPPTLGQLILSGDLASNSFFTHYTNFFFKGLAKAGEALRTNKPANAIAEGYAKLDELGDSRRLKFRFSPEHLTSDSAWSELTGQRRLLFIGAATDLTDDTIEAIPWVIANPIPDLFHPKTAIGAHWTNRLEIFADQIDNFDRVQDYRPSLTVADLNVLRSLPESAIKHAFAEIIGEPTIPKDWGGERSDLFTTNVRLGGNRLSAAFAFKGPAKFHPMTAADLGKNGDQIDRLFSEPADFIVLQHCHEITPPVRGMMRAYAQQMGHPRLFCLINGYDTIRILEAYEKCGLRRR